MPISHTELQIETADGHCPTHVYHPAGSGPWPGVIMYMDGIGMRPALMEIAERIANSGYYVLLPNLFYRVDFDASNGMKVFTDPDLRKDLMTRVLPSASAANVMRDSEALFAHLAAQREVDDAPIGVMGYCMGGRLAVFAAGHFGGWRAAAASYPGRGPGARGPH